MAINNPQKSDTVTDVADDDEIVVELGSIIGVETFKYDSIDKALAGIKRIYEKAISLDDGITRHIAVVVNPDEDEY